MGWVGLGWVGLGWVGLGWVGLGWVGLGWVGLGWVNGGKLRGFITIKSFQKLLKIFLSSIRTKVAIKFPIFFFFFFCFAENWLGVERVKG